MDTKVMQGHYQDEDGLVEPGHLTVLIDDKGNRLCEDGGLLRATPYEIAGTNGYDVTSARGAWTFVPDAGEVERCGIPVSSPSEDAKAAGLKSLAEVSRLTGVSVQTLINWHESRPSLYRVILAGCAQIKAQP